MKTYVALIRGINVGGRNTVPMAELREMLGEQGLEDVVTYIQSGNVVFRSSDRSVTKLAARIEDGIGETFGCKVRVILRTPTELERIAAGNPFLRRKADPAKLHVVFLDAKPAARAVADLDPGRSPPDEFEVRGSEIYVQLPNGAGRSKLTIDYFERRLGVKATHRNWRTLLKLVELMKG
jgi:uncharacterized protein (DUF1697 family)